MRSISLSFTVLAALLAGCGTGEVVQSQPDSIVEILPPGPSSLSDATHQTGSSTIAHYGTTVFNVNTDAGTVSVLDTETNALLAEVVVGAEPTRLAIVGDQVFVTLRGERAVAVLSATDFDAAPRLIEVGAEPFGVVGREDGQRAYVSLSQSDSVIEIDGGSLRVLRTIRVAGEPRYLALHPSGTALFVGSARGLAKLTRVDLQTGSTSFIPMPQTRRLTLDGDVALVPRITGDLWLTSDGEKVLVPTLFSDNTTPILEVDAGQIEQQPETGNEGGGEGYGGRGVDSVDKFTPSVVEVPVGPLGETDGDARALFVSTSAFTPDFSELENIGSYLTSVTASPNGARYLVTMEASRSAVLIDPNSEVMPGEFFMDASMPPNGGGDGDFQESEFITTFPSDGGFHPPALVVITSEDGTNGGLYLSENRAFLNNAFADSVSFVNMDVANQFLGEVSQSGMNFPDFRVDTVARDVSVNPLPAQVRLGRDLFYSATNNAMGVGGISCSTCHIDGRNDGITWTFETGPRQTPSLAGVVSETVPVTWKSEVDSVATEADITTRARMGGEGMSQTQLDAIAAFVDYTREVDTADKGSNSLSAQRGEALFNSAAVGCISCHSGERGTDNQSHAIRGVLGLNTPSLTGVAATAPYMHDGSAATLRDVLELGRTGAMGNTGDLTDAQLDDLEAYLRSL